MSAQEKTLDLEEFFNKINVRNDQLIKIKESIIQLLKELVKEKIIFDHLLIELKSGKKKEVSIKSLTTFNITRRIKNLRFTEKIKNRV
jgi:hypothetical protein